MRQTRSASMTLAPIQWITHSILAAGLMLALLAVPILAQDPGTLDPDFGTDGTVTTDLDHSDDYGQSVAIQTNGKILVAGLSKAGPIIPPDYALVRYNTDGSLDTSFNTTGKVTTDFGDRDEKGNDVAVQPDGKIIVVGNSDYDVVVLRYNSDGSLDTTFSGDGIVTTAVGPSASDGFAVTIQSDGKIVVAGRSVNVLTDDDFTVLRYNSNGSLDASFGNSGVVITDFDDHDDNHASTVAIQSDGKILVAGSSWSIPDNKSDCVLIRYDGGGNLDTTFNSTGFVVTGLGETRCNDVVIQHDGKIVAVGTNYDGDDHDVVVIRYNSDGSLDTSFNNTGIVMTDLDSDDYAQSVALQSNGKIVVAGSIDQNFALMRYKSDGSPDTGFSTSGIVTTSIGTISAFGQALAIQPDGKIVVAGHNDSDAGDIDFAVARYIGDDPRPCAPTISSVASSNWHNAATWNLNRVPNINDVVRIETDHTVIGPTSANVHTLCNFGILQSAHQLPLHLIATKAISNYGHILGRNGTVGSADTCGDWGSNVTLEGSPIYNAGTIQAGHGGSGDLCGGAGGSTYVFGRNTTNVGTICAGRGGDALSTAPNAQGGDSGETHVWGKWGGHGFLLNQGLICAGDGGDSYATGTATLLGQGGDGGRLKLISQPNVFLSGGQHYAGQGGQGVNNGLDGRDGRVFIEPNTISLAGSGTEVRGGNITIFGGDGWALDLRNLDGTAISATDNITLAVGAGGTVDLSGNTGPVLWAGGRVLIASDVITLTPGITLTDVVSAAQVETSPAAILSDVSLAGPGAITGQPGTPSPASLTILNGGPLSDTYTLTGTGPLDWTLSGLPLTITVPGLEGAELALTITPPPTARAGNTNTVIVTAISQHTPNLTAVERIQVYINASIYLPLILKSA